MSDYTVRLSFNVAVPLERRVYHAYKSLPRSRGQSFLRHCLEEGVDSAIKRFHIDEILAAPGDLMEADLAPVKRAAHLRQNVSARKRPENKNTEMHVESLGQASAPISTSSAIPDHPQQPAHTDVRGPAILKNFFGEHE